MDDYQFQQGPQIQIAAKKNHMAAQNSMGYRLLAQALAEQDE